MKKIVFFSTPAFGHLNCVYPVIEKLVKSGYQVDWYCSKRYRQFVEKTGAAFIEYKVDFDKYDLSVLTADLFSLFQVLLKLNRECYREYSELIRNNRPDIILYDSMCSFAKNISEKFNIRSVCFCTTLAYNTFTFIFSNMFFSTIKLISKNIRPIVKLYKEEKKFRKNHGIKKLNAMDLFVNKGNITLVFSPKEFQPFYRTFPKDIVFIGTTIKDRITNKTRYDRYDIYISLGSVFTENIGLLNKIVNSNLLKNKKSIMNIGSLRIDGAEDVEFVSSTDQISLLPNIELFITHGGLNSIYESLYFGKFQICVPQQEEQRMNSIIVGKKKLGAYIKSLDKLDTCITRVYKKRHGKNIQKYKRIIRSYDGTKTAFEIIDGLANGVRKTKNDELWRN